MQTSERSSFSVAGIYICGGQTVKYTLTHPFLSASVVTHRMPCCEMYSSTLLVIFFPLESLVDVVKSIVVHYFLVFFCPKYGRSRRCCQMYISTLFSCILLSPSILGRYCQKYCCTLFLVFFCPKYRRSMLSNVF